MGHGSVLDPPLARGAPRLPIHFAKWIFRNTALMQRVLPLTSGDGDPRRPAALPLAAPLVMLYTARMDSVFEIIGPSMVGPSSSHTAGAIRVGRAARALLGAPPVHARIGLHGSFAATGAGHATDRGLVAGLLGFATDDERMKDAFDHARAAGLTVEFETAHLGDQVHPNTASLDCASAEGLRRRLIASSIGGGMVQVVSVDGFPASFTGALDTLVLWHSDVAGFLARVTAIIACVETNIAAIRTARQHRGESALTVVEMDAPLPASALDLLGRLRSVTDVRMLERF